jgi:CDP-diacylglycerol--glycerol-3-phosphate 3-phosphatidyltransferase
MRDVGPARDGTALRGSPLVPRAVSDAILRRLDRAAGLLVRAGVSANAVTIASMILAAAAGISLGLGEFALATPAMALACLGDALDGLVARRSASISIGGALLDASVDRYGEFFFLGGLAVCLRGSAPALVVSLLALSGSFMVSYASAKAEALHLPVPPGLMRRPERAITLCLGVALAGLLQVLGRMSYVPEWTAHVPLLAALGILAVFANGSAMRRLRRLAYSSSARPQPVPSHERAVTVAPLALERVGANETREPNAVAAPRAVHVR